jgi:hypothetical protein
MPEPPIPPPVIQYYAPIVPYSFAVRPSPGSDPRLVLPGQTHRSIPPPLGPPRPGAGLAHPPRAYPTPPRLYPTPPREYPTPSRDWPQ